MLLFTKYYDSGAVDGGGNPDPTPDPDQTKFESFLEKGETNLTAEEKVEFETLKGKYNYEAVGEDGKPLTEEQKKAAKETQDKLNAILAKPEKDRTIEDKAFLKNYEQEPTPEDIYKDVDLLNRYNLEGYNPAEFKFDAEGIAKRENFLREQAVKEYDNALRTKYPRGYAFLEFLESGGKEEDFFKLENKDFSQMTVAKSDEAGQERIYRMALSLKGVDSDEIDALVQVAKDQKKLFDKSKAELDKLQKDQEQRGAAEAAEKTRREQIQAKDVNTFLNLLQKEIEKGVNGNPLIPAARTNFFNFITQHSSYKEGKFYMTREIDTANLAKELAAEYYRYTGGDMTKLVEAKAKTLNAQKFKKAVTFKITPKQGSNGAKPSILKPLGEL